MTLDSHSVSTTAVSRDSLHPNDHHDDDGHYDEEDSSSIHLANNSGNSPLATYRTICSQLQTHCNSGVQTLLPETQESLRSVKHLDFGRNCVGRKGLRPILWTVFQFCPELESLDLSRNYLSNESVEELFLLLCERDQPQQGEGASTVAATHASSTTTVATSTAATTAAAVATTSSSSSTGHHESSHTATPTPLPSVAGSTSSARRHWNGRPTVRHPLQFSSSSKLPFRFCPKLSWINLSGNPISNPSGKLLSRLADIRAGTLKNIFVDQTLMNPGLSKLINQKCGNATLTPESARTSSIPQGPKSKAALNTNNKGATEGGERSRRGEETELVKKQRSSGSAGGAPMPSAIDSATGGGGGGDGGNAAAWSGMEALWTMAAVAAPPEDGWTGLATVMALVRQDVSIASRF